MKEYSISKPSQELAAIIYPTTNCDVFSCSDGLVSGVFYDSIQQRTALIIKSDGLLFHYTLDFTELKKGDRIKRSYFIGRVKNVMPENTDNQQPLILIVLKGEKVVDARKYLRYCN